MTDDTANRNVIGLRRVLRAKAEEKARGVVSSNPLRAITICRREPECACTTSDEVTACDYASRLKVAKHDFDEKALQEKIISDAEASGVKVIRLTNLKDHPDIVMMSSPNSPEARAAFDNAPLVGPSAAELWARSRPLGQPYQPVGTPPVPTSDQIAEAIARHERTPRDAFDVFLACADAETVYDFSSETKLDGDRYVITVTATPRKP